MDITGFALVVGGGSGIGRECALAFAEEGASGLIVADLDLPSATKVAAEANALAAAKHPGFRATPFKVDVTSEDSVNRLMACVRATSGRLDYCVNCAGIGVERAAPIAEASLAEFNRFLDVNVSGTFLVTRAASSMMAAQEPIKDSPSPVRGAIVNMGSAASFVSTPQMVQYTASKHAILGLTKNAALDNAALGIRVNCICASWVDTPMVRKAIDQVPDLEELIQSAVPMGRMAHAKEIADSVMFLCSERSSYITGCGLVVDGGTTLTTKGYITDGFPAAGLPRTQRHITGHDTEGKSVFLVTDCGSHHRNMGDNQAVANILYSTKETPIECNGDADIKFAEETEASQTRSISMNCIWSNISSLHSITPMALSSSPLHRAISVDYGVVIEGVFELTLDSGESRIMRPGDVSIQRATSHKWKNVTGNGTMPGRMLWVLLPCNDIVVDGKKVEGFLGHLAKEYERD
ncbi:unnamed protein product [Clonostachys chloroleuca]|uniref:NAD(P)-binding protein n=1 Tax=Clonostachys chloroleuca TaxID=1926264 RepID=A0AA35QG54_9HYPO|nr:unnamed protein product [Clonostachys chloroleuca]